MGGGGKGCGGKRGCRQRRGGEEGKEEKNKRRGRAGHWCSTEMSNCEQDLLGFVPLQTLMNCSTVIDGKKKGPTCLFHMSGQYSSIISNIFIPG